jgi:hypothetical protein
VFNPGKLEVKGLLLKLGKAPNKLPFPGFWFKIYYLGSSFLIGSGLTASYLIVSKTLNMATFRFWFRFLFF